MKSKHLVLLFILFFQMNLSLSATETTNTPEIASEIAKAGQKVGLDLTKESASLILKMMEQAQKNKQSTNQKARTQIQQRPTGPGFLDSTYQASSTKLPKSSFDLTEHGCLVFKHSPNLPVNFFLTYYDRTDGLNFFVHDHGFHMTKKDYDEALKTRKIHESSLDYVGIELKSFRKENNTDRKVFPLVLPVISWESPSYEYPFVPILGQHQDFSVELNTQGQYLVILNEENPKEESLYVLNLKAKDSQETINKTFILVPFIASYNHPKKEEKNNAVQSFLKEQLAQNTTHYAWPKELTTELFKAVSEKFEEDKRKTLEEHSRPGFEGKSVINEYFGHENVTSLYCEALAQKLSEDYEYAHEEINYKNLLHALQIGKFQCDTAAAIMVGILKDAKFLPEGPIPARIQVTYPTGYRIKLKEYNSKYNSKQNKELYFADFTGPAHAKVLVYCGNNAHGNMIQRLVDPTPKQ